MKHGAIFIQNAIPIMKTYVFLYKVHHCINKLKKL